jgi:hypothetical protein
VRYGRPPRLRNTDNVGQYYGYFENRYGEQFVYTPDRTTGAATVSGGGFGGGDREPTTFGLLDEALRNTRDLAAQFKGRDAKSQLPVIEAAQALGRHKTLAPEQDIGRMRGRYYAVTPGPAMSEEGIVRGRPTHSHLASRRDSPVIGQAPLRKVFGSHARAREKPSPMSSYPRGGRAETGRSGPRG